MSESQQYTTVIIAALPADGDPIHKIVAEDAHVTLHFLGEAAELPEDAVESIKADLELIAGNLHPFAAKLSGTAELGEDKAKVVLVESAPLTKIREILGGTPAVSTALAATADKQYPNWIPHLTLSYEDESPDASPYEEFTVGAIGLWVAGEQVNFPLAKAAPGAIEEDAQVASIIAAGLKKFDSALHPRGADGRFIEKFGVVKYLSGGGWAYGKVEGINKDESGEVKVTVTPSDLNGKVTGAESLELAPKQLYRAPKAKAHLTTVTATKIGGQGGSNPGGLYEIPDATPDANLVKYYVKKPKSKTHGQNEELANLLYEEAGVPVPEVDYHADGQIYSKIVEGEQDMASRLANADVEWMEQVRRNFAVDAWLGNRDVFGMTYDNILTDDNGVPWRIDNGGALLYRAMGEKKTDFGSKVTELESFRQGKKAKIYGAQMTKAEELDGAERIIAITPGRIEEMVADAGLPKSLADTLKARRLYIADYYGLQLPETQKPEGGQVGTTAPLVDAADLAASKGKPRSWFKVKLHQAALLLQTGDKVEFPDNTSALYGVKDGPLSALGAQAQLLGWQTEHGADAEVMFKKGKFSLYDRPEHGSQLVGADLADQNWQRGDAILSEFDTPWKIKGANPSTGAVLVEDPNGYVRLLDTFGADSTGTWTVQRWDPPAPPQVEEPETGFVPADDMAGWQSLPADDELTSYTMSPDTGTYVAAPEKTGQAAVAETKIKADLDQSLPTGNGAPAPKKTSAQPGEKKMLIGDGTEAVAGAKLVSKKDGKTYTFVKPKGQYAVVTDPDGEDPSKQLLKLASTMTQPGVLPAGDLELPKTATGEVPALGMMAEAKDGWAGEITMISPDGKFVFITDANGKRKRKSTGAVSVTSAPQAVADMPKVAAPQPGPIKAYGEKPHWTDWKGEEKKTAFLPVEELSAKDMVLVGYSDGSVGLEPYSGQPIDSIGQNVQNKVAVYGQVSGYLGPISSTHLAAAGEAAGKKTIHQVIYSGNVFFTDGTTGPNGGLVLWYAADHDGDLPGDDAFELPAAKPVVMTIISSEMATLMPLTLPEGINFQPADESSTNLPQYPPLYGEEAMTLSQWKGQLAEGMQISLDGDNWLSITDVGSSGSVKVVTGNGSETFLNPWSTATYVIKAPTLKDGDAPVDTPWTPEVIPAIDVTDKPTTSGTKAVAELAVGDVVTLPSGISGEVESVDLQFGTTYGVKLKDGQLFGLKGDQQLDVAAGDEAADAGHPLKQVHTFIPGDVILDGTGTPTIIAKIEDDEELEETVYVYALGESAPSTANPTDEFQFLGNIEQGAVTIPIGLVAEKFKPGTKIQAGPDTELTVLSYAVPDGHDGWKVAVGKNGDPEQVSLLHVGAWDTPGVNMSNELAVPIHLAPVEYQLDKFGLTPQVIDALFDTDAIQTPKPVDHHGEMAEQGLDFGKAQYPIFYNGSSDTYFRNGPSGGTEEWDGGSWNAVGSSTAGMLKVWDGVPFTGKLQLPVGFPEADTTETLDYKPGPGEVIVAFQYGGKSWLVTYPGGYTEGSQGYLIENTAGNGVGTAPSLNDWHSNSAWTDHTVIHDPFADTPSGPQVTHTEGAQPSAKLGAKLQAVGYTPKPGETLFVVEGDAVPTGGIVVHVKQPDGKYSYLSMKGTVANASWPVETLLSEDAGFGGGEGTTFYTWTYLPDGEGAPTSVQGMPEGYEPFVPSEGQSVIKHTSSVTGTPAIYVQKQPGSSWFKMNPDGTLHEHPYPDAIFQSKLAGKNVPAGAKYELLHPKPEGLSDGDGPPKFSNKNGDWTPEAGQKVVSYALPGDTDPWFYVQGADGYWNPSPNSPSAPMSLSPETMDKNLAEVANWSIAYDGSPGETPVDTTAAPSFTGYTPKPGEKVLEEQNGSHWVFTPGDSKFHPVNDDGTLDTGYGIDQQTLEADSTSANIKQVWPATDAAEAPSFNGYTPQPGDQVISINYAGEPPTYYVHQADDTDDGPSNYSYWMPVTTDGYLDASNGMSKDEVPTNLGPEFGNDFKQEWPTAGDEAPAATETPSFKGYTPKPGEKVVGAKGIGGVINTWYVQEEPGGNWFQVKNDGTLNKSGSGVFDQQIQGFIETGQMELAWDGQVATAPAAPTAAINVNGFQTSLSDNVITVASPGVAGVQTLVQADGKGAWHFIGVDGVLGSPQTAWHQDTIDWAVSQEAYTVTVLQGTDGFKSVPETEPLTTDKYAGVKESTSLLYGAQHFGTYSLDGHQSAAMLEIGTLSPGESVYAIQNGTGTQGSLWIRYSTGEWKRVDPGTGIADSGFSSDEEWEKWVAEYAHTVHKMQFGAPQAAPKPPVKPYAGPTISGWQEAGVAAPASFSHISDSSEGKGAPAGSFLYLDSGKGAAEGVFVQLAETWDGSDQYKVGKFWTVMGGKVVNPEGVSADDGSSYTFNWPTDSTTAGVYISADPAAPSATAPTAAPSAPQAAPAAAPVGPQYPGAHLPSQEDINAWGGSLTKDGHIPSSGMHVTGKGPMSGKIVSVSKDKTKATVLTTDGKKTVRLIEALKTDKSANYSAYAAPATLKDIPSGMPLAVDTPAEVLAKTVKDGKFRAIVSGHPGVSGGSITVTKATGPSGKAYNRVHLALTNDQREQLMAMLSGTGEKGDWATSSKMSDAVAIGDQLPMRKSSTDNPDGTPRWKVDSSVKPPTHEVTAVEELENGIRLVTMKDKATGEIITSRFHPGKDLTVYAWDANKPKMMTAGSFVLSEAAKGMGWAHVTDGGISSATGGAADAKLHNEPGSTVTKSVFHDKNTSWKTLRNISDDGVVIEVIDPKGSSSWSTTGTTVISIPEGLDEKSLGAALSKLGVDYSPMTQEGAKNAARGLLRNLLSLDTNDVDSVKGWTDEKLFTKAGQTIGISDLGWQDVLVGVDESTGKTSFFWSDRARNALAGKTKYNLVYRSATTGDANAIVSTVKYGSANSVLKRTTGMIDAPTGKGTGASWETDLTNKAGHGSYVSAGTKHSLPSGNDQAGYKGVGMMIYHRPEAVLGRIMDYRTSQGDAFGKGQGPGADHLAHATKSSEVKDFFMGGGLPTEAVGFIAVKSASARDEAIKKLKADGYDQINGRPIEEIVILMDDAKKLKPSDLPPVILPLNARSILDLPVSYDTPSAEVAA